MLVCKARSRDKHKRTVHQTAASSQEATDLGSSLDSGPFLGPQNCMNPFFRKGLLRVLLLELGQMFGPSKHAVARNDRVVHPKPQTLHPKS